MRRRRRSGIGSILGRRLGSYSKGQTVAPRLLVAILNWREVRSYGRSSFGLCQHLSTCQLFDRRLGQSDKSRPWHTKASCDPQHEAERRLTFSPLKLPVVAAVNLCHKGERILSNPSLLAQRSHRYSKCFGGHRFKRTRSAGYKFLPRWG